jgi:pyruvate dehydrogenase E1 component beta subunit
MEAAQTLADDNISAEVINLRTLSPLDTDTIMASVAKTNRVVIAQEAVRRGGVGSDIASYIQAEEFYSLDAPIEIVAGLNIPIPFNLNLEKASVPQSADIVAAAMRTLEHA